MRSHILPSYGHSLDKTARSVDGWSTRRIVDRHHRMTLDRKRETPMNSTPTPKAIEPRNSPIARAGAPGPRRLAAGSVHRCHCPGFAVVLWRRGQGGCRPYGAARFNSIIVAGRRAGSRAARSSYRSSGRGAGGTTASNALGSGRTARRRADSYRIGLQCR
jgi:hypothetical protein